MMIDDSGIVLARLAYGKLETVYGDFDIGVFHDGNQEAVVLSYGDIRGDNGVFCRIHSECVCGHVFLSTECDCHEQMEITQQLVIENKKGIIIYLKQEGKGNGAAAHIATLPYKRKNIPQGESYRLVGFRDDARQYDIAGKILNYFAIQSVTLITSNKHKLDGLARMGINVVSRYHLDRIIWLGKQREIFVDNIKNGEASPPIGKCNYKRVFIVGELNVDISIKDLINREFDKKKVGGTAFNAARALKSLGFEPIIFGKIGKDKDGELITNEIKKLDIQALLGITKEKPTGIVYLYGEGNGPDGPKNSSNDYDSYNFDQATVLSGLNSCDIAILDGYMLYQLGAKVGISLIDRVCSTGAFVVFDLVPHLIYNTVSLEDIQSVVNGKVNLLIGELRTFAGFLNGRISSDTPSLDAVEKIMEEFTVNFLVLRYGLANISTQEVWCRNGNNKYFRCERINDTGYSKIPESERSGFGDELTASLLKKLVDDQIILKSN